jgi:hypothetical protein
VVREYSLSQTVQTDFGARTASYSVGTDCSSPRRQSSRGVKLTIWLHLVLPRLRMIGAKPPFLSEPSWRPQEYIYLLLNCIYVPGKNSLCLATPLMNIVILLLNVYCNYIAYCTFDSTACCKLLLSHVLYTLSRSLSFIK